MDYLADALNATMVVPHDGGSMVRNEIKSTAGLAGLAIARSLEVYYMSMSFI